MSCTITMILRTATLAIIILASESNAAPCMWKHVFKNHEFAKKILIKKISASLQSLESFAESNPSLNRSSSGYSSKKEYAEFQNDFQLDDLLKQQFEQSVKGAHYQGKPVIIRSYPPSYCSFMSFIATFSTRHEHAIQLCQNFKKEFSSKHHPLFVRWAFLHEFSHIKHNDNLYAIMLEALQEKNDFETTKLACPNGISDIATAAKKYKGKDHKKFFTHEILNPILRSHELRADTEAIKNTKTSNLHKLSELFTQQAQENTIRRKGESAIHESFDVLHQLCLDEMRARSLKTEPQQ